MIEIRHLRKCLNDVWVLDGIDLTIEEGDTVAVMGPSGTGKSVLLKHIVGLFDPDEGEVYVDGDPVSTAGAEEIHRIRSKISYVFQNSALFDSLTVGENIRLGLTDREREEADVQSTLRRSLELVNLGPEVLPLLPAELSGGMQKRVAIARAIVGHKKYILYDEPTTGLDPVNAAVINSLIGRLKEELGTTNVIVTHDVKSAFDLSDRVALLMNGRVRAEGTPDELRSSEDPSVQEFLRGESPVSRVA
ncbi:MAG: ATP-binding cassette domain-containing protein [Candidatus Palauibacterales bacterium]|nr:ATP-binding cassette domain-containing protein [Candidatus Palauibacterales bacterium]